MPTTCAVPPRALINSRSRGHEALQARASEDAAEHAHLQARRYRQEIHDVPRLRFLSATDEVPHRRGISRPRAGEVPGILREANVMTVTVPSRRGFITGLISFVAAPA